MTDKDNAPQGGVTFDRPGWMAEVCHAAATLMEADGRERRAGQLRNVAKQLAALQSQAPDVGRLPMLPPSVDAVWADWRGGRELLPARDTYYTAEQMRAYALAALSHQPAAQGGGGEREAAWRDLVQRAWQVLDVECPNEEITDELLAALNNTSPGSSEGDSHE